MDPPEVWKSFISFMGSLLTWPGNIRSIDPKILFHWICLGFVNKHYHSPVWYWPYTLSASHDWRFNSKWFLIKYRNFHVNVKECFVIIPVDSWTWAAMFWFWPKFRRVESWTIYFDEAKVLNLCIRFKTHGSHKPLPVVSLLIYLSENISFFIVGHGSRAICYL